MRALAKVNGDSEQRARVSDELRQLKQMSKGLRTKAVHALHASQRHKSKPAPVAEKGRSAAAA